MTQPPPCPHPNPPVEHKDPATGEVLFKTCPDCNAMVS